MSSQLPGRHIICISPFRCRMWNLHDRTQEHITEGNCREEIVSFQKHGQLVPVLGRRLRNDPSHDVELIFGARRLFIARHLNVPVHVELRELTDREAVVAMDIENRLRRDISPYERGVSYSRWLRDGLFASQEEIAAALRVSGSQVSRLLKIARLPAVILNAFADPADLCEGWGLEIAAALENPAQRDSVIRKARELARVKPRLNARTLYRELIAAHPEGRRRARDRDDVIVGRLGRPLFRIHYAKSSITLVLPADRVSMGRLRQIRESVKSVMESPEEDFPDTTQRTAARTLRRAS